MFSIVVYHINLATEACLRMDWLIGLLNIRNLPPWQQNIFSSIIADIGKQLKQSVKVFHNLILYRLLPGSKEPISLIS